MLEGLNGENVFSMCKLRALLKLGFFAQEANEFERGKAFFGDCMEMIGNFFWNHRYSLRGTVLQRLASLQIKAGRMENAKQFLISSLKAYNKLEYYGKGSGFGWMVLLLFLMKSGNAGSMDALEYTLSFLVSVSFRILGMQLGDLYLERVVQVVRFYRKSLSIKRSILGPETANQFISKRFILLRVLL